MINDALHPIGGEKGHTIGVSRKAGILIEVGPLGIPVLRKAKGVLTGIAQGGPVHPLGTTATDVANHELKRTPNGGIRPVPLPQRITLAIHADGLSKGSAHHHHGAGKIGGGQKAVHAEGRQ